MLELVRKNPFFAKTSDSEQRCISALAKSPPAFGALDFSQVAYVGYSLGGNASFEACARDSRCVTAVDLDGTIFSEVRRSGVKVPGLILQADGKGPAMTSANEETRTSRH